jgi:hypothetical protein
LPSRPHFSPDAATTPATKKKAIAQTSSPLSIMSTTIENDLLDIDKDKDGSPDLSKSLFDEHMESKYKEYKLYNEDDSLLSPKVANAKEDGTFTETFMNMELDDLDEFEASLGSCLDDLFHVARETEAPMIHIKDKDYEFNVDPEKLEKAEAIKFNGREDELPWEHLINLFELANVFGNTEIQKRYYFLNLFLSMLWDPGYHAHLLLGPPSGTLTEDKDCSSGRQEVSVGGEHLGKGYLARITSRLSRSRATVRPCGASLRERYLRRCRQDDIHGSGVGATPPPPR